MGSLGFSGFRQFVHHALEDQKKVDKVNGVIETNGLILFFVRDGEVYGAPEESRLVFAKMKNPDDDSGEEWVKEASFVAFSLKDAMDGREVNRLFQYKDLKGIKVISQDEAATMMSKNKADKPIQKKLRPGHGEHGAGIFQIKDRK